MKFQAVKGMRDFYPEDMRIRNWIVDAWRRVSIRHGFQEYDGPILENLQLYTVKSGEGIIEELFHLEDRGGRELAIRPEMTPTLARMINARSQALGRPIKWYSIPRLCRAERPQRGRLREFFQWNIDIVGVDDLVADAECILVVVDFFRDVGLTPDEIVVRINSRSLMAVLLTEAGVPEERLDEAYVLLDRGEKIDPEKFEAMWTASLGSFVGFDRLRGLMEMRSIEEVLRAARKLGGQRVVTEVDHLGRLFELLDHFGVSDFCEFNIHVIRGLAYYTGPVFEAFGKGGFRRAICGGGRYDGLLRALGGPAMSGVGFGTSDVVIREVLEELNRLPSALEPIDVFVIDAAGGCFENVLQVVSGLRRKGLATEFSYRRQPVGKQLRTASQRNARWAVLVGQETIDRGVVALKDLASGVQTEAPLEALLAEPGAHMAGTQKTGP